MLPRLYVGRCESGRKRFCWRRRVWNVVDADGVKDGLDLNAKWFAISCVLYVVLPAVINDGGRRVVDITLYLQGVVDLYSSPS